ncbi:hypothetical protein QSV35_01375 [Microbacterium sp. ASV49]|uniref:Uncharacterized protein n=1 Tax=Microbacterium candidum TaxID=3041922 RepID=A0ABT7MU47_9MICO|nr:hypothetical protein [Microbacterium sp. ASV49]
MHDQSFLAVSGVVDAVDATRDHSRVGCPVGTPLAKASLVPRG